MTRAHSQLGGVVLSLASAALVAAGCASSQRAAGVGAGNTAGATGASGSPRARLIARADQICRRANEEVAASRPATATAREIARVTPRNVVIEQRALAELNTLTAPPGLARDWQLLLSYRHELASELGALVPYAKAGDTQRIDSLARSKRRTHRALLVVASRAGFRDCGVVG